MEIFFRKKYFPKTFPKKNIFFKKNKVLVYRGKTFFFSKQILFLSKNQVHTKLFIFKRRTLSVLPLDRHYSPPRYQIYIVPEIIEMCVVGRGSLLGSRNKLKKISSKMQHLRQNLFLEIKLLFFLQ